MTTEKQALFPLFLPAMLVAILLSSAPFSCFAQENQVGGKTLSGVPAILNTGLIVVGGERVSLWGIDRFDPDQQCWQGDVAWCCGEESLSALRHFLDGRAVECHIETPATTEQPAAARCYRQKGHRPKDVAEFLVRHGWALDRGEVSGGAYFQAEDEAQKDKRGVWGSRFQTVRDWRDGVQRFVGEQPPAPAQTPAPSDEDDDSGEGE